MLCGMPSLILPSSRWIDEPLAGLQPGPRLLAQGWAGRVAAARAHPAGARLWTILEQRAEAQRAEPVIADSDSLTPVRACLDRMWTCGLHALVAADPASLARTRAEAEALAALPSWGRPGDWLATAECLHALAVACDWAAQADPALAERLLEALVRLGLDAADQAYADRAWWWRDGANWNGVCNGSVLMACLVAGDRHPVLCRRLAGYALAGLPLHLASLAPDGAHPEGPGYWAYTWRYLAPLIDACESALGHDFGLSRLAGLADSAWFRIHHEAPSGRFFAWSDSYPDAPFDPVLLWQARRYGIPAAATTALRRLGDAEHSPLYGAVARALLWWSDPGDPATLADAQTRRSWRGPAIVCARSGWDDQAAWIGLKGGDVQAPHAHRDLGAVAIELGGVRWLDDPGAGDYGAPGYWDGRPASGGGRWRVFHCAAEGHGTLLVDGDGVHLLAQMDLDPADPAAVSSDSAFADRGVTRWTRRVDRVEAGLVTVTDTLECRRPIRLGITWVTGQTASVVDDGVVLTADGRRARLEVSAAAGRPRLCAAPSPWTRILWETDLPPGRQVVSHRLALMP
jgi:hypothetical protein